MKYSNSLKFKFLSYMHVNIDTFPSPKYHLCLKAIFERNTKPLVHKVYINFFNLSYIKIR